MEHSIRRTVLECSLILVFITVSTVARSAGPSPSFEDQFVSLDPNVQIDIANIEGNWAATVTYTNAGVDEVCLDVRDFPQGGHLRNGLFQVWADGVQVAYAGGFVSYEGGAHYRDEPVRPGETLRETVVLGDTYDLPDRYHSLSVRFVSIAQTCGEQDVAQSGGVFGLVSERVDIELPD